ncbi:CAP-Gly domain-containing linker protein 1-like isoform X1, partial [Clarias magur]
MPSCSVHHCVLFLLTLTLTTAGVSAAVCSTTVKLHHPVTLSCEHKCSVSVKWTLFYNRDVVLARCDQTSCSSQEGFTISHDQYKKGDLSLTITKADYSLRDTYSCECGISEISTVRLSIETVFSAVQMHPGEDLKLDLSVPESVKVIYRGSDSADGVQICNVTDRTLQCHTEYTPRTSLSNSELTLRDVTLSDSGIYTIRDTKSDEDICVYTVSVTDDRVPWWVYVLIVLLLVFLLLALIGLIQYRRNAVHRDFIEVSKQLGNVNKLVQRAEREQGDERSGNSPEALQKAEEAMKVLEERYRENAKYSEQIKLFCAAKREQLRLYRTGEEERLLLTHRGE